MQTVRAIQAETTQHMAFEVSERAPINIHAGPVLHAVADWRVLFDMHYELELGIVVRGGVRKHFYDGSSRDLEAGEVWTHGISEPHGLELTVFPHQIVVLEIWPPFVANLYYPEAPFVTWPLPFLLPPSERPRMRPDQRLLNVRRARQLAGIESLKSLSGRLRARWLLTELLLEMGAGQLRRGPAGDRRRFDYDGVAPAVECANASRNPILTAAAARLCGMTERHFARVFTETIGMHFAEFALRSRVRGAARDLAERSDLVKTVALSWGFVDSSHFDRTFRKYYRCTPADYRARHTMRHGD